MVFATSNSSFSSFRAPVVYLAKLATRNPIEVIVTTFCAVTLVYFQLLGVSTLSFLKARLGVVLCGEGEGATFGGPERRVE